MAVPDRDTVHRLLHEAELPDGIRVHSEGVARVAVAAAGLVAEAGIPVDGWLVEAAALLHDIDKPVVRRSGGEHGVVGARQLTDAGHEELAMPVASHPVSALLDEDRYPRGWPSVIVAVADRHVAQEFLTIDERLDDMKLRHPEYAESIESARRPSHALEAEVAEVAGLEVDDLVQRLRGRLGGRRVSAPLILLHGDDGFGLDLALREFGREIDATDRVEILPDRSPDEAALDRARLEAGTMSMFGAHLTVLRQPLKAAGRSTSAADRLIALVGDLPEGSALALLEERPSRDLAKPPALLKRLADAITERGGRIEQRDAPRRNELRGWITSHAGRIGVPIEVRAAHVLAERIGGAIWETDIERGEMTRIADSELHKLATYVGDRPITADDVAALTADTRPASVFAITNALDRREPAAMADALRRALEEGQPGLRILASLAGRVSDLIVARDLAATKASPSDIAKRVARGNARMAERLVDAAKRYRGDELDAMLVGLWQADVAIKSNEMDEAPALVSWIGEHVLATRKG